MVPVAAVVVRGFAFVEEDVVRTGRIACVVVVAGLGAVVVPVVAAGTATGVVVVAAF